MERFSFAGCIFYLLNEYLIVFALILYSRLVLWVFGIFLKELAVWGWMKINSRGHWFDMLNIGWLLEVVGLNPAFLFVLSENLFHKIVFYKILA